MSEHFQRLKHMLKQDVMYFFRPKKLERPNFYQIPVSAKHTIASSHMS